MVSPLQPLQEKQQQQEMCPAPGHVLSDMQPVPSGQDQVPFQGVHLHDGDIDEQGEKEGE